MRTIYYSTFNQPTGVRESTIIGTDIVNFSQSDNKSVIAWYPISENNHMKNFTTTENHPIQVPNGGPSPIPYGFEGRTGIGTRTGEVILD